MLMNQSVINRPELPENTGLMVKNKKKDQKSEHINLKFADIRSDNAQKIIQNLKNHPKITRKCDNKENLFIRYFLQGESPRKAAVSVGYSESTASKAGNWLNSNFSVNPKPWLFMAAYHQMLEFDNRSSAKIESALTKRKIDAHFVEVKILEQLDKANADIPAHYKTTKDKDTGEDIKTPIYKYNQPAALKALELLGKHKAIKAFDNEVEHKSTDLSNLLSSIKTNFRPPSLTASQSIQKSHIDGEHAQSHPVIDVTPSLIVKRKAGRPRKSDAPPKLQVKKARGRPKKAHA